MSRILTQISGHPFTMIMIFHGDLLSQSIPVNNNDNWSMVQKLLTPVHMDPSQQPQQRHQ